MYKLQIHTNNNAGTFGKYETLCFGKVVPIICGLQLSSLFKPLSSFMIVLQLLGA